jgi:hypothetical protein
MNSRDLSRPSNNGRTCICDRFELVVDYAEDVLIVRLSSDLPVNTRVAVTAQRLFRAYEGSEWYWTTIEEELPIKPQADGANGFTLKRTNDELDIKGLNMYRYLKGKMSLVIEAPPSPMLTVTLEAPAREHKFGLCNRGLTGAAVTSLLHSHLLERTTTIMVPVSAIVIPQLGF